MARIRFVAAVLFVTALTLAPAAQAGRSCETHKATVATVEQGLRLAQRTHEALEAAHARDGVQVVLLARAGRRARANAMMRLRRSGS